QGHSVDILDFSIIYPNGYTPLKKIFEPLYTYQFWKYLKQHAHKYDVIDANVECIPYSKESFGFKGLLLARSHGMRPVYMLAEKIKSYKDELIKEGSNISFKTKLGNLYRSAQKQTGLKEFYSSIKYADIVHCLNHAEYDYLLGYGLSKNKLIIIHNGLLDSSIEKYTQINSSDKINSLCFIGAWTIRKGIKDFDRIISEIKLNSKLESLLLLGGNYDEAYIRKDFSIKNQNVLKIYPSFKPSQIPAYIRQCKVGIFPSYLEGFALALIEQLACGIPVVAYKIPGSTDILSLLDNSLLIEPGNTEQFAKKVSELLELDTTDYTLLSEKCKSEAKKYLLSNIATQFINLYYKNLNVFQSHSG
ncbi:MAG: glycosyltransferase family 4 protein, partial [Janthinobacterium lividum]